MILSCQDTRGGLSGSWFLILTLFIAWLDLSDGLKAWNVSFIFVRWVGKCSFSAQGIN